MEFRSISEKKCVKMTRNKIFREKTTHTCDTATPGNRRRRHKSTRTHFTKSSLRGRNKSSRGLVKLCPATSGTKSPPASVAHVTAHEQHVFFPGENIVIFNQPVIHVCVAHHPVEIGIRAVPLSVDTVTVIFPSIGYDGSHAGFRADLKVAEDAPPPWCLVQKCEVCMLC